MELLLVLDCIKIIDELWFDVISRYNLLRRRCFVCLLIKNTYDNFTLNSVFRPDVFFKKKNIQH